MQYWIKGKEDEAQKEIARLYTENKEKIRIFVNATVRNAHAVEDIVQDVFVEALIKYEVFRTHPNQLGWLYVTARNKVREYERRMSRQEALNIDGAACEVGEQESGYLKTEMSETIRDVLTADEILRFRRYFIWGYTIEELARREGVSHNTMEVRIHRLRKKLQREIKP